MKKQVKWSGIKYRSNSYLLLSISVVVVFAIALLYKLGTVPNLEVDEVTYFNEIRSLARYGTDIHGLSWPLYFAGVFGYGQSVEYAYFVVPIIKLIGFSVLKARLPLVLLTLFTMGMLIWLLNDQKKQKSLGFWIVMSLSCSPWIFISSRWILDCNIAPITFMLGLIFLCQAWHLKSQFKQILAYIISALLIAASVAGYMAGWLFIPIVLILIVGYALNQRLMGGKNMALYGGLILILVIPSIVFAYNFIVVQGETPGRFLWFSYPAMPILRGGSFINMQDPHVIRLMLLNFITGINRYVGGSDGWAWNSVRPYGVVFPFLLLFSVFGAFTSREVLNDVAYHFKNLMIISMIAFFPLMFLITPVYFHWNFINWTLAILIGYGLYNVQVKFSRELSLIIMPIIVATMFIFVFVGYYGHLNNRTTYFTKGDVSVTDVHTIAKLLTGDGKHSRRLFTLNLRVKSLQAFAMFNDVQPITNQQMLSRSDNKKNFDLAGMSSHHRYANIYDKTQLKRKYRKGDFLLIFRGNQSFKVTTDNQHVVQTVNGNKNRKYRIIRRLSYMNIPMLLLQE